MTDNAAELERLNDWLNEHIDGFGRLKAMTKFTGGQSNPTFRLKADSGDYVLRRKPPGQLLKSAHAVDREFRVIRALADTPVPVAKAYALCEDDSVIGSMFYVMACVPGRVFWDPALPEVPVAERAGYYDQMNQVLADLHDVDVEAVGLADYGAPGSYFERQVSRWSRQYQASQTETIEAMDRLMAWLPEHLPEHDGQVSLIHGDYRQDNMIFHPSEPRVSAVIDWELSTLGHPFADLAYQCMQWRLPPKGLVKGLGGLDRRELGIPTEEEYVERYCQRRGLSGIDHWNVYLVFCLFRLAAIVQGVVKRGLDGNASSDQALRHQGAPRRLAEAALDLMD